MNNLLNICLVPFEKMHIKETFHWVQDEELQRLFLMRGKITWEGHQQYFQRLLLDPSQCIYAIITEKRHLGNCGFKNIDAINKVGELWVYIGEPSMRKKGLGLYATKLLLECGFEKMDFEMIYLHVAEFNIAARTLYTKLGFTEVLAPNNGEDWSSHGCNVMRMELRKSSWMSR